MIRKSNSILACFTMFCTVSGLFAQMPPAPENKGLSSNQPKLFVAERIRDLGHIMEGDKVTVSWTIVNQGTADLVIDSAAASCGCTVVKLSDEEKTIHPGKSLELKAEFDSTGRRETQSKTVTVNSNDPAEPTMKLEFRAEVDVMFEMQPNSTLAARSVRRGEKVDRSIEIFPGRGRGKIELLGLDIPEGAPLTYVAEPFEFEGHQAQRITISITDDATVGPLKADLHLRVAVDGIERWRDIAVNGSIVGDLSYSPLMIKTVEQTSSRGLTLTPIIVRSPDKRPFEIFSATAGPHIDVVVDAPSKHGAEGTEYRVALTIRDSAPDGPLAAELSIITSTLDQPVIRIPVFVRVAPLVDVDPPVVLLRADGSQNSVVRRLKFQASPKQELVLKDAHSADPRIKIALDSEAANRYKHVRFLLVGFDGAFDPQRAETKIVVTTNVPGAEQLEIPVRILAGADTKQPADLSAGK